MIIDLEGPDGCGKTTQGHWLFEKLKGYAQHTHQPIPGAKLLKFPDYTTPSGKLIEDWLHGRAWLAVNRHESPETARLDALALQAAYTFNRMERAEEIRRFQSSGYLVIDRYWPSGVAYGAGADGLDVETVLAPSLALPQADLNILVDISVETAMKRQLARGRSDRYEGREDTTARVRKAYHALWTHMQALQGTSKWVVVDGERPPEVVASQIFSLVHLRDRSLELEREAEKDAA